MRELKGSKSWLTTKSGKKKCKASVAGEYLGLFDREDEADVVIAARIADLQKRPGVLTCRDFVEDWFKAREESKIIRSVVGDRYTWTSCVEDTKAAWLDMEPRHVKTVHVQEWLDGLCGRSARRAYRSRLPDGTWIKVRRDTGEPLAYESIKKAISRAKLFFKWLKSKGKLPGENPVAGLIWQSRKRRRRKGTQRIVHLVEAEIRNLFGLDLPIAVRAAYAVAIYAGLRPSELWALQWEHIDFKAQKIYVRETRTGDVKTASSLRDVTLLPYAASVLQAYKRSFAATPLRGLLFPAKHGGIRPKNYTANWADQHWRITRGPRKGERGTTRGWRTEAGIREEVTFQCFRHTTACQLLQGTVLGNAEPLDIYEVSTWLGHSSVGVTQRHYAEFSQSNVHNKALGIGKKKRGRKVETKVETGF